MSEFIFNIIIFFGFASFAYLSWKKTELGIYAIIFCLPLYLIRFNVLTIPSTALEIAIYILFASWFIKNHKAIKLAEIVPDKDLRIGIMLLFTGVVLSTIFSGDLRTSAGILKGWFFDPLLFYLIFVSEIKLFKQKAKVLRVFFYSGFSVAAISLFYWLGFLPNGVSYDARLHGFYLSPNYLAMYLSPALIAGIWSLSASSEAKHSVEENKRKQFLFEIIFVFVIALAVYYTFSFAAWFAVCVCVFLYLCLIVPPSKRKILAAMALLAITALFYSQSGSSKFENLRNFSYRSSYNSRLMIWQSAIEVGKDNFFTGIGPGNFQRYYLKYQERFSEPYLEWAVPEPHNTFLAFWLESGFLGFIGVIVILAWFFSRCLVLIKNNLPDKQNLLLVFALLSLMVYSIIHGLFDTLYWKNDLAIFFWFNLALLVNIRFVRAEKNDINI